MLKKDMYIQNLRAISIMAVVLIHILPVCGEAIIIRQFLNFCVAMFLFISGYLTNSIIDDVKYFYKKRISRIFIPYIIWSFVFILLSGNYNLKSILARILTGQGCGIYYYILVYAQMVIITPLLIKTLDKRYRRYIYLLTPISILVLYILKFLGLEIGFPYNVLSFTVWIIFYYYGLNVRFLERDHKLENNLYKNIILYIIFIVLSIIEGFIWNENGDYSMAVSQIKITSIISSIYFIKVSIGVRNKIKLKNKLISSIFLLLGDYSFGIYLTHMLFVKIFNKIIPSQILYVPISLIAILLSNCIFIYFLKKILKEKAYLLGF
ncbi:MAG: acyltransferase [Clostridium perfringens]|nr:acyltransferase [Clostridium perfringens]MDU6016230.1 acyltransferase [Clostridium perfringens]